jgi:hypothetical protein
MSSNELERIHARLDEIYDRVSEIKSDMKLLKYKVAVFSAAISALFTLVLKKVVG